MLLSIFKIIVREKILNIASIAIATSTETNEYPLFKIISPSRIIQFDYYRTICTFNDI